MNDEKVSYIVHESAIARMERTTKRLVFIIVLLIIIIFASNVLWLYEWNQYEYEDEIVSYQQDGEGANVIGEGNQVKNEPKVDH